MAEAKAPLSGIEAFLSDDNVTEETYIEGTPTITEEVLPELDAEGVPIVAPVTTEEVPAEVVVDPVVEPEPEALPEAAAPVVESDIVAAPEPIVPEPVKDKPKGTMWKEHKQLQRAYKDIAAENERLKAKETPAPVAPVEEELDDPFLRNERLAQEAKAAAEKADQRITELEQRAQQAEALRQRDNGIEREEAAMVAQKSDYEAAKTFLIESRLKQYDAMGLLDSESAKYIEQRPDLVERYITENPNEGWDADEYSDIQAAAKHMAGRIAAFQEREALIQMKQRTGRNFGDMVYKLSESMGYKVAAAAAPVVAEPLPEVTARERVQRAKAAAETQKPFTQKLPTMPTNPAPLPKPLTKRSEILKMPEPDMDKLIEEMDAKDPSGAWMENLDH